MLLWLCTDLAETYKRIALVASLARYVRQQATSQQQPAGNNNPAPIPNNSNTPAVDETAAPAMAEQQGAEQHTEPWTPTQQAALWVQNRRTANNKDRREWIERGKYVDPFEDAGKLLGAEWAGLVLTAAQGEFSQVIALMSDVLCVVLHLIACANLT